MASDFTLNGTCSNCGVTNIFVWGSDKHITWDDLTPHPWWVCKYCLGGHNPKKINYHKMDTLNVSNSEIS